MATLQQLHDAGAHMGLARTRRHPTASSFIYSTQNRVDVFDLEGTVSHLAAAIEFVKVLGAQGKAVLFVGGKNEVQVPVRDSAIRAGVPFVAGRWIGGTLTNFKNIRGRIDRLEKLTGERERGELAKYTKRERLMIDREIEELEGRFGGIVTMRELPSALFVVDTRHEHTAVKEAQQLGIPVIGLSNTDCDFAVVKFPIPANDTSLRSVKFVTTAIADAYLDGKKALTVK